MTILVTGVACLNGAVVVQEFAHLGEPIRAPLRNRAQTRRLEAFRTVALVEGDVLLPPGPSARRGSGRLQASVQGWIGRTALSVADAKPLSSGVVILIYRPARQRGLALELPESRFGDQQGEMQVNGR